MTGGDHEVVVQVVISTTEAEQRAGRVAQLNRLGYQIVGEYETADNLKHGLLQMNKLPDIIITDETDPEQLRQINQVIIERRVHLPFFVIHPDGHKLLQFKGLDFIANVGVAPLDNDDQFQIMVMFGLQIFEKVQETIAQTQQANESLETERTINHACSVLEKVRQLPPGTSRQELGKIAGANGLTLSVQAKRTIDARRHFIPNKERKDTKGKS